MYRHVLYVLVLIGFAPIAHADEPFRDCAECPEMVRIPAGQFMMGTSAEETVREKLSAAVIARESPVRLVTVMRAFALSATEVTRDQFEVFVNDSGWTTTKGCFGRTESGVRANIPDASWRAPGIDQAGQHPVICIAYEDAVAYADWLSRRTGHTYRLPTEAEWEYAARGETTTTWYWGNDRAQACAYANVPNRSSVTTGQAVTTEFECDDNAAETSRVGAYRPNKFGLYDMIGNVWEWTEDCLHPSYDAAPSDSRAWVSDADCGVRVVRGGGWSASNTLPRSSARSADPVTYRGIGLGFRIARDL